MIAIRTVLCPVDLSQATGRQLQLATDLCRAFKAGKLPNSMTDDGYVNVKVLKARMIV